MRIAMPRRRSLRGIVEVDVHLVVSDDDLLDQGFCHAPTLLGREGAPALGEVLGSEVDFFFGELALAFD